MPATNSEDKELGPIRRWILTYLLCMYLLHAYGVRAWPWNVQVGLDQKDAS